MILLLEYGIQILVAALTGTSGEIIWEVIGVQVVN